MSVTSLGLAANFDFRDAGNYLRHANGDKQLVGPGIALEENVRAADVSGKRQGASGEAEEDHEETFHSSFSVLLSKVVG